MSLPHIFHKWKDVTSSDAALQFTLFDKCAKCGLIRKTNLLLEETSYFHLKETSNEPAN